MGDPPRPGSRVLNTVVEINGKRLRTAGIQADQLEAIWAAAQRLGKGPVAQVLKAFGAERSVHLSREEAEQVLAKLKERLSRLS